MSDKYYIKLPGKAPALIDKPYFTVGIGAGYDLCVDGLGQKILFTLHREQERICLIPGDEKIRINTKAISKSIALTPCDRIEWKEQVAIFMDGASLGQPAAVAETKSRRSSLEILKSLSENIEKESQLTTTLNLTLRDMVDFAGAEVGYLVSEMSANSEWSLLASVGEGAMPQVGGDRRRQLISSTILNEAIETRKPVYVESMIGHPWERQASIMGAQIFSLACLPLLVGDRIFGALYLYTRTPGISIRRELLTELHVIASQVALCLASQTELRRTKQEIKQLKKGSRLMKSLVFDRDNLEGPMAQIEARLGKVAASELAILIRGETGTGKELIAREIHNQSPRAKGPFVAINCAAIPPSLMESTLFGYVKGAFTGAHRDRAGKFVQANGGTIFLDEIGDLPLDLQVKLLRVLQEREVEAVGADKAQSVDFRVIAATHQDLDTLVKEGKFRQDLYYRLNGASLNVPALRSRGRDILLLANHFLKMSSPSLKFSAEAEKALETHRFPGNVRELEQVVSRAALLATGSEIKPEDLELNAALPEPPSQGAEVYSYEDYQSLKEAQLAFTRDFVKNTLNRFNGNRTKVASHLGISERTLYRLLANDGSDLAV